MKVSDALEICPSFATCRNEEGKVVCRHMISGEMCTLPTRFRCELIVHKERQSSLPAISHSRAGILESCPRLYMLTYLAKAKAPKKADWKTVGSAFAVCRARIDSGQPWIVPDDVPEEAAVKLEAVLEVYSQGARPQVTNEVKVEFEHKGVMIRGYADAVSVDGKKVYEWKYAQSADSYTALTIARQVSVYLAGLPNAEEVVIAVAKKTRHKLGAGETRDAFKQRILAEYQRNRSSLFEYKTFPRSMFCVEREMDCLRMQHDVARLYIDNNTFPPNYWNCSDCDFEQYCLMHSHIEQLGCHAKGEDCGFPGICEAVKANS